MSWETNTIVCLPAVPCHPNQQRGKVSLSAPVAEVLKQHNSWAHCNCHNLLPIKSDSSVIGVNNN